jgi:hypothetical protein
MNICQACGIPLDANYFDNANIKPAPTKLGEQVILAQYTLHPQYCGVLLHFAQYAEPQASPHQNIFETPGYEWAILCNNQPFDPYLPTHLILNPWGQNNLPIHLRLEEGCEVRLVVKKVSPSSEEANETPLARVGGRLQGRYWYNTNYGGLPNRL